MAANLFDYVNWQFQR